MIDESDRPRQRLHNLNVINRSEELEPSFWDRELPKLYADIVNVLHKINVKRGNWYDKLLRLVNGLFDTQWFRSVVYQDGVIVCSRRRGCLVISFSLSEITYLKLKARHKRERILVGAD